jgi:cob(I)alamin adenosyltransferase
MVKINRVYTRTGDDGRTGLGDGARIPKFHPRVAAYASVEEANSFVGLACVHVREDLRPILYRIQNDLFDVGADLCRPDRPGLKLQPLRVSDQQVQWLEHTLETYTARLKPLSSFVLPGGSVAAATLHVARTTARRAERDIVELAFQEPVTPAVIRYMNRVSDVLFVLARIENDSGNADALWKPGGSASSACGRPCDDAGQGGLVTDARG